MGNDKRPATVATIRLPRGDAQRSSLVQFVWAIASTLPKAVVAVRQVGDPGIMFVSRNLDWCFESTRATPHGWMVEVAKYCLSASGEGTSHVFVGPVGGVEGQQELDLEVAR